MEEAIGDEVWDCEAAIEACYFGYVWVLMKTEHEGFKVEPEKRNGEREEQ